MAEYWLVTVWRIEAPLAAVYAAVCEPLCWPEWWPDAQRVEQRQAGAADGVGRVLRCTWQGHLPYRLSFDLHTTRMQPLLAVEGAVDGDLQGTGRCLFAQEGTVTTVRHEWRVRTTRRWMNLLAPLARPLFTHNHALAMRHGGEGLARRLNARFIGLECRDLGAADARPVSRRWAALAAGLLAGVIATLVQMVLWWLADVPVLDTLLRDTRLTAAMTMGPALLASPSAWGWSELLLATLIHFMLSAGYGLLLGAWLDRTRPASTPALLVGGLFGLVLYAINLYALTPFFPWFAVTRGWITALTHLAFGVTLAGGYLALRRRWRSALL